MPRMPAAPDFVPQSAPCDDVAPPPALPVQAVLYITPDGHVQFGALFDELLPLARALDPTLRLPPDAD